MPEGLDEAARAFQTEIAPAAVKPRDESGRFTSTAAKPEPLFQDRVIEGDPLTGDTRDGGDDARLARMERRVADGWAEEGDEAAAQPGRSAAEQASRRDRQRVSPAEAGEGARHAAADQGHERAEAEPERLGHEPEQSDQDAEGGDQGAEAEGGEGSPDGTSEQDAEGQSRFRVTLDGQPVERFEVTVDGAPVEVSLDEALKGYVRERTFHQRMSKVQEARQQVDEAANHTAQWRDYYGQKLQQLDRELAELTPAEPNWDEEFAKNPAQARDRQKAYAAIYGKRAWIQQESERTALEARQEYDRKAQEYAINQFGRYVQEANIPDERALQSRMGRMRAYGKLKGFSEGELATVYDSRMLHVLDDASKYHELMANKPKAIAPGKGRALVPGVATPIGNATRRNIDEAQNRLAKTGRLEDAASVMARLIR